VSVPLAGRVILQTVINEIVSTIATELVPQVVTDAPDPGPRRVPRDLRMWLARLRLLEGVPFSYLVADSSLLPPESIRFFYVDRGWTDALVEGALSVGTVTTADRSALERIYGTVRTEVDEAERLVRLPGAEPGAAVPTGLAGPITGFVLRSRLVSGWPALHVRGYAADNLRADPPVNDDDVGDEHDVRLQKLSLLRLERLAPAVLLALFDGIPQVVHIEEPRAGIQFGVDETDVNGRARAQVLLRNATTGERLDPPRTVRVPFRRGAPGVLHMRALAARMTAEASAELGPELDAAEFALQMLQFPFRAVFADRTLTGAPPPQTVDAFRPRIGFVELQRRFAGEPR
jgi:hypothetical protein